ncbi:DEAD/DEAH box helicase [Aquincola sp. MAHUQ-54]|uniref:DEAD/DEAH box helicase n=1 Tax=Aquincola agrisoli TaxID=3119538 RepID=A0AAW9Q3A9_9BURK
MPSSKSPPNRPPAFVNLRGEPIATGPAEPGERDLEAVFDALCLGGSSRSRPWVVQMLREMGHATERGERLTAPEVGLALDRLLQAQRVRRVEGIGFEVVPDPAAQARFVALMQRPEAPGYWRWVASAGSASGVRGHEPAWVYLPTHGDRVGVHRLVLFSGIDLAEYQRLLEGPLAEAGSADTLVQALTEPFMPALFDRLPKELRAAVSAKALSALGALTAPPALLDALDRWLREAPQALPPAVRCALAERRLHRGDPDGLRSALDGLKGPLIDLFQALPLVHAGRWSEGSAAASAALKAIQKASGRRQSILSTGLAWPLALALLAQPDAAGWTAARKFAIGESGSRTPPVHQFWGLWAHAAAVRLGDQPLDPGAFAFQGHMALQPAAFLYQGSQLLLSAWLGVRPDTWTDLRAAHLIAGLESMQQHWMAALAREACERHGFSVPPPGAGEGAAPAPFLSTPREAWRDALAAIAALGGEGKAGASAPPTQASLLWRVTLDGEGRVSDVQPFERPASARGKPKAVTLAKLKASARLDARDAAVARSIERARWSARQLTIDVTAAVQALVRHPDVEFDDAPGQRVELTEALPQIEVARREGPGGAHFVFRIDPPLQAATPPSLPNGYLYAEERSAEIERRNSLRIVRDAPDRARLIRITAAQRRVAELVSQDWAVPVDAQAELDAALKVLSGHFQLHSDAAGGQEVAGESRLRAQFVPVGDALQLRLVAMPFGSFGPAVTPGVGRERLMTMHEGLSLATRRHLAVEREHLRSVLDALPFLDGSEAGDAGWLLDTPELALQAVELLPTLPAIAGLDWPRGRPLRVASVASPAMQVRVTSGRDWFSIEGELQLDDGRVVGLQQLLQMAQQARTGRFVALGEGDYLALTERLRQQLADLAAVADVSAKGRKGGGGALTLPAAGAAWLEATLDGMQVEGDNPWRERLDALEAAAALVPALPRGLQAELRGYQTEGYAWMARLAHAGLGACLADDMGLGKTVQTLALLLARAADGPALVIAPTSLGANWLAEAQAFAPGLRVLLYGDPGNEATRDEAIDRAGPGDVVVASYALAQIDNERFARRQWATLVLDEAQAVKNAATKRAKSVGELRAGFRLALTGTPVENRLADLWSIMNVLNPGLLGTATQFGERFGGPIERQQDHAARVRLKRLVSPFLLRRTKAQVLTDLPPRTEIVHHVEPTEEERAFLEALRRNAVQRVGALAAEGHPEASFHVLAELTRLRRAACDPRLVSPELGLVGSKAQAFEQLVRELVAGQHKALVFSQFTDFLKLLAERLDEAGIAYQYLDGSTPAPERARRVAAFQRGEGELFLISLKAGGFGLNLTMADYVLIVDPWWNPAAEDQAMGRAHRIGQQRPVTVYRLVTAGSVEERIVALHRDKRGLADGLLEGQDQGRPIGAEELRSLLLG